MKTWLLWATLFAVTFAVWKLVAPTIADWPKVIAVSAIVLLYYGLGYWRGINRSQGARS